MHEAVQTSEFRNPRPHLEVVGLNPGHACMTFRSNVRLCNIPLRPEDVENMFLVSPSLAFSLVKIRKLTTASGLKPI